jgi:type III secretory pathway component EscV
MKMSVSLATLKNKELKFENMDGDTVALDVTTVNACKRKVKQDYTNIINDWDNVMKHVNKLKSDKNTKGKILTLSRNLHETAKKRKNATTTKSKTMVSRIDKDVAAYSDDILGQKIKELEAKIAELMAKIDQQ